MSRKSAAAAGSAAIRASASTPEPYVWRIPSRSWTLPRMSDHEELWIPLVDEPIGSIVGALQATHPEIDALVSSPHRILAFRTFAYIRVGVLLGQLLVDNVFHEYAATETWIEALLRDPRHEQAVVDELR